MNVDAAKIMLVEDDSQDLELTLRALGKANLADQIQVARDGVEALDFIFGEGSHAGRDVGTIPRLILLDIKLPKVDGMAVLEPLKADSRTRSIPVVMLTSSSEVKDLTQCYRLGVNSYIVKPVNMNAFVKAVQDLGMYWLLLNEAPEE